MTIHSLHRTRWGNSGRLIHASLCTITANASTKGTTRSPFPRLLSSLHQLCPSSYSGVYGALGQISRLKQSLGYSIIFLSFFYLPSHLLPLPLSPHLSPRNHADLVEVQICLFDRARYHEAQPSVFLASLLSFSISLWCSLLFLSSLPRYSSPLMYFISFTFCINT